MNYTDFVNAIQTLLVIPTNNTDANFTAILPRMIEYGELRIYRDMDFLPTLASQTATLSASSRNVVLPPNIIVLQSANVITPASATIPDNGTRNPMTRVSPEVVNMMAPSSTPFGTPSVPSMYAVIGEPTIGGGGAATTAGPMQIIVGSAPDAAYTLECLGTIRPTPLSPTNTTTFITLNMPDIFVAACMVFGSGYQKNFSAVSDDPKMSLSWEGQYQALKQGVSIETLRQKAQSWEWTATQPSPIANQSRDHAA